MNLRRQLLIVSLMTLVLPWAGCQFIQETERALRDGQQDMLAGTARAIAENIAQYPEAFPPPVSDDFRIGPAVYGHRLDHAPRLDGYVDDWPVPAGALQRYTGVGGSFDVLFGLNDGYVYLFVAVSDSTETLLPAGSLRGNSDRVELISVSPPYLNEQFVFAAEAPGAIVTRVRTDNLSAEEPGVTAYWQDVPGGYQLEARIPERLLGLNLGIAVTDTDSAESPGTTAATYSTELPGPLRRASAELAGIASSVAQPGIRLYITDADGWRLAEAGSLDDDQTASASRVSSWLRRLYDVIVDRGTAAALAAPAPSGRERQSYVRSALAGTADGDWYRSEDDGSAVVAVSQPVRNGERVIGAVVLQRSTAAILSLTNEGLIRLLNVTLLATLAVAGGLLGYATWLSQRIRKLSRAAEAAVAEGGRRVELPSSLSGDEIGDLSRSFASVLGSLGEYNAYLQTLASKLSHELRTPLAIVTSSLDNLEHEPLGRAAEDYTQRAKDGADRLRRILNAMSEAKRVEELMKNAEPGRFDLHGVLESTVAAYRDAYPERRFEYSGDKAIITGAPELLIQMLDKLVDNAVSFSGAGDTIALALGSGADDIVLSVENPGPPLPDAFRNRLFDSLVSVRQQGDDRHLGLGLHIARIIAEGHGGSIRAENTHKGVRFSVLIPA